MSSPNGLAAVSKAFGLTIQDTEQSRNANGDQGADSLTNGVNGESKEENTNGDKNESHKTYRTSGPKQETSNEAKGSVSTAKNIYMAKGEDGEWTWVDECPKDIKDAAENSETEKFALIVRNKKSKDSRKSLEADSIIINSPWLKDALEQILEDYPGVTCNLRRLVFQAPFKPFVHRWSDFIKFMKRDDLDATTKDHVNLLFEILKNEIGNEIKEFEDYVLNGVVTFESMWMIFQPGGVVISEHKGPLSAFEVVNSEYIETQCGDMLRLSADCVDWDGSRFGRSTEYITLPKFSGTKKITSLKAFPMPFFDGKEKLKLNLVERGKQFEELAGHHYKAYDGQAITWDHEGNEKSIQISGRIIVDTDSFDRFSPYASRFVGNFSQKDLEKLIEYRETLQENGTHDDANNASESSDDTIGLTKSEPDRLKLTPYHQMLCRSRVRGYSLKTKKWLDFFVPFIQEIKWNNNAFENLVLPSDRKETVLAFSESQLLNRAAFDDVISGKGRGCIMLLSGPPGVGKTLTAEAVAEFMHCPLHSLTSGDLGSDAWNIEQALSKTLELVARWNAILLIDECDVFLEARATHDLARNQIVSIFLRTLEYYEGIMFMTTNRADNIDAAFQSRIHVSLEYPDLTDEARRQIWATFLKASEHRNDIGDVDLDELCKVQLNGRQIKNVLKTAQLLALRKKRSLDRGLVEMVLAMQR